MNTLFDYDTIVIMKLFLSEIKIDTFEKPYVRRLESKANFLHRYTT